MEEQPCTHLWTINGGRKLAQMGRVWRITEPHSILFVFPVPKVHIFGDQDIFVKSSSTVHMKCVISQSLEPPNYIEWRHNEQRLSPGLGGHTRIQATPPEHIAEGTTMSTLTILEAAKSDSGEYTCHPAQMDKARVMLHVLDSRFFSRKSLPGY